MQDITTLRKLRTRVRHTVNIVSTSGRVFEEPGDAWAADMSKRIVYWTPTFPLPPHGKLKDSDILYLIAHEASHLNASGLIDYSAPATSAIPEHERDRFHRFVNAIEDVRVDRLSSMEFGGFRPAKEEIDLRIRNYHLAHSRPEGWSLVDLVGMNAIYSHDLGLPPFGSQAGINASNALWPYLDRIANLESTQAVAEQLAPIYLVLQARIPLPPPSPGEGTPGEGTGSGSGDGSGAGKPSGGGGGKPNPLGDPKNVGADSPSNAPVKSTKGDPGTAPISKGDQLRGMKDDPETKPASQRALEDAVNSIDDDRREAQVSESLQGAGSGVGKGVAHDRRSSNDWDTAASKMRPQIATLKNRLKSTLYTNSAEAYESGHRRGQLHATKAYRSLAGNPRIFRQRRQVGSLDYSFGIIVDRSGSMRGNEGQNAMQATVGMVEALEGAGLGCFVIAWNGAPTYTKPIDSPIKAHRGVLGHQLAHPSGGTYEGPALSLAIDQFKRIRSGHRLMFTITDGDTRGPNESKLLVEELRAMGVRVVAIGINFEPASHYPERLKVKDATELYALLPRYINSMVKKGA